VLDRRKSQNLEISQHVGETALLVEDNATDVFVIRKVLAECVPGLDVRVMRDGQDALRYIRELATDPSAVCPALILLDLNIPKVTGLEILRELRSGSRCSRTPVIIVTSSGAEADRASAKFLRADGYFRKPSSIAAYRELGELARKVLDTAKEGPDS
jgi:CheY-like chemotaxis protein